MSFERLFVEDILAKLEYRGKGGTDQPEYSKEDIAASIRVWLMRQRNPSGTL